jgi:Glycosyltransferase GT-D fold
VAAEAPAVKYPTVLDEFQTMQRVRDGASLARYGDGEAKLAAGAGYSRQKGGGRIAAELRAVLNSPAPGCLVGLPTMNPEGPKYANWTRHRKRFEGLITRRTGLWGSAFVTRPDSAPWIECPAYLDLCVSVWQARDVVLLCEPTNKLLPVLRATARSVRHVECPSTECYRIIGDLQAAVMTGPDGVESGPPGALAVLSCGVVATCLANRLTAAGVQALDFGSAGGMLTRLLWPADQTVSR